MENLISVATVIVSVPVLAFSASLLGKTIEDVKNKSLKKDSKDK